MHFMEQNSLQYKEHLIAQQFPLIILICSLKAHNHLPVNKHLKIVQYDWSRAFLHTI